MGVLVNRDTGAIDAAHVGDGGVTVRGTEGYTFLPLPLASDGPGMPFMMSQRDW
jgi:hypothetical protein